MLCLPFTSLVSCEHLLGAQLASPCAHTQTLPSGLPQDPCARLCVLLPSSAPCCPRFTLAHSSVRSSPLLCPAEAQPGVLQSKDSNSSTKIKQEKPGFVASKLWCLLALPPLAAAAQTRSSRFNSACGLNMISALVLQPFPFSICLSARISAWIRSRQEGMELLSTQEPHLALF